MIAKVHGVVSRGVSSCAVDENGHLIMTLTDNSTVDVGRVTGTGIVSIEKTDTIGLVDTYTVYLDDGSTKAFYVTNGNGIESILFKETDEAGNNIYTITLTNGATAEFQANRGLDGNGIASAVLNDDYTLTLNFTNGTSYTTTSIRGAAGGTVSADGMYGFSIEDGHLILHYVGDNPPDFFINDSGHLILNIDGGNTIDIGRVKGDTGEIGPAGQGVPSGGTEGQILIKSSDSDYDAMWGEPSGGLVREVTDELTEDVEKWHIPFDFTGVNRVVITAGVADSTDPKMSLVIDGFCSIDANIYNTFNWIQISRFENLDFVPTDIVRPTIFSGVLTKCNNPTHLTAINFICRYNSSYEDGIILSGTLVAGNKINIKGYA